MAYGKTSIQQLPPVVREKMRANQEDLSVERIEREMMAALDKQDLIVLAMRAIGAPRNG